METIINAEQLKDKIDALEKRQQEIGEEIKHEFKDTYEHLKPSNLIKDTFSSPNVKRDIAKAAVILAIGFIAKRVITRASRNPLRIMFGSFAEVAVASYIAKHPDKLERLAQSALRLLVRLRGKKQPKLLAAPAV